MNLCHPTSISLQSQRVAQQSAVLYIKSANVLACVGLTNHVVSLCDDGMSAPYCNMLSLKDMLLLPLTWVLVSWYYKCEGLHVDSAGSLVAGAIWSVALTPDGRRVITASEDFTARVWDVVSGNCAHVLDGHTGWVVHVCATADGLRCATASHDGTARSAFAMLSC